MLRDLLDGPGVRMTYLRGALELMSPSRLHEDVKTRLARLLELWALERDVPLYGYGSTTFRVEPRERGLEPDECYVVGQPMAEVPELAIEVVAEGPRRLLQAGVRPGLLRVAELRDPPVLEEGEDEKGGQERAEERERPGGAPPVITTPSHRTSVAPDPAGGAVRTEPLHP